MAELCLFPHVNCPTFICQQPLLPLTMLIPRANGTISQPLCTWGEELVQGKKEEGNVLSLSKKEKTYDFKETQAEGMK